MITNMIYHVSIDKDVNSQVRFEDLDEVLFMFFNALGIEVVVTSDEEVVPEKVEGLENIDPPEIRLNRIWLEGGDLTPEVIKKAAALARRELEEWDLL